VLFGFFNHCPLTVRVLAKSDGNQRNERERGLTDRQRRVIPQLLAPPFNRGGLPARQGYRRQCNPRGAGDLRKTRDDLMKAVYPFQKSPRCSATSKRTRKPCKAPAVKGWTVCRFHGARGGGPKGKRNGMYRHGRFTEEAAAERTMIRELLRRCTKTLSSPMAGPDRR
jgi:hypothetical protein